MIHAQGRLDIRTGGEGVVFQIGNIKAFRHLSLNDVNISTFPNKFSEKVLASTSLSTICQVNLAETCMHAGGNISECGNSTAELQKRRNASRLIGRLQGRL
jgi:hypothetical protein